MPTRRLVMMLIVGLSVAFLAVAVRGRMEQKPDAQPQEMIMVAKRDLTLGTLVQPAGDLAWEKLPAGEPSEEWMHQRAHRMEDYYGAVVRRAMKAGEPVVQSALMKSGEGGFMSAVLEPGMSAVSVAVTATSGAAGFISPGDRIDLIVTHHIRTGRGDEGKNNESVVSETFVRNVRVVAVDQMLNNPENKAILAKTVTVEVNNSQAEQIAVASEMGKISMALRSSSVNTEAGGAVVLHEEGEPSISGERDVSRLLGGNVTPRVRIIRGDQIENMEFAP